MSGARMAVLFIGGERAYHWLRANPLSVAASPATRKQDGMSGHYDDFGWCGCPCDYCDPFGCGDRRRTEPSECLTYGSTPDELLAPPNDEDAPSGLTPGAPSKT